MMDDHELERIYSLQIAEELSRQNKLAVTQIIEQFPTMFGLEELIHSQTNDLTRGHENLTTLYQQVCDSFLDHGLTFDHVWVKRKEN